MEHILEIYSDLRQLHLDDDIFFLDRGFRFAISILKEKYKLKTMMPNLLSPKQKQFSSKEANESRICTKFRWVVEGDNGLIKGHYRVFDHRVENKSLPHFLVDLRISGALVNKFCKRLLSDKCNALQMAETMYLNMSKENDLIDLLI